MSCGTGRGGWGRRPKPKNFGFHFSWKQQHVLLSFASLWEEALNANFFCYSQSKHTTASVSTQDIFPTNISVFQCPCYAQEQLATEDFTILIFLLFCLFFVCLFVFNFWTKPGVGLNDPHGSFPTQVILWFYGLVQLASGDVADVTFCCDCIYGLNIALKSRLKKKKHLFKIHSLTAFITARFFLTYSFLRDLGICRSHPLSSHYLSAPPSLLFRAG